MNPNHRIPLVCANPTCPRRNYTGTRKATICPCCWDRLTPRYKADMAKKQRLEHLLSK